MMKVSQFHKVAGCFEFMETGMFTVKEVSEILNVSPHALRFYDNEGLLPGLSRRNTHRLFSYEDLEWVRSVQCWRESGMSVADIRRYLELYSEGDGTLGERRQMILEQRDRAIAEVKAAKERVKMLDRKVQWHDALVAGEDPNKFRPNMYAIVEKAMKRKRALAKRAG